jgi:signal transduction histidine kinase
MENEDLAFMGKINASISHELKNIMAIISETSGLLNDLMEMADRGKKIETETIRGCCRDIEEEIERGFTTIKQMNRFAHSVDEPVKTVDLKKTLKLMVGLAGFLSHACDIRFDDDLQEGIHITTCPFRLQNLIYRSLVFAFSKAGIHGQVNTVVRPEGSNGARIAFSGFSAPTTDNFFNDASTLNVAVSIGAELAVHADRRGFDILLCGRHAD